MNEIQLLLITRSYLIDQLEKEKVEIEKTKARILENKMMAKSLQEAPNPAPNPQLNKWFGPERARRKALALESLNKKISGGRDHVGRSRSRIKWLAFEIKTINRKLSMLGWREETKLNEGATNG